MFRSLRALDKDEEGGSDTGLDQLDRRNFLKTAGAAAIAGLAGCVDDEPEFISEYDFDIDEELDFRYGDVGDSRDEIEVGLRDVDPEADRAKFSVRYNVAGFKEGIYAAGTEFWMETEDEVELTQKLLDSYNMAWQVPDDLIEEIDIRSKLEEGEDHYMSLQEVDSDGAQTYFDPAIHPTEDKSYE